MTNMLKKVFNWSDLSKMTCYKIHTLVNFTIFFLNLIFGGFCYLAQRAAQWMTDCNVRE